MLYNPSLLTPLSTTDAIFRQEMTNYAVSGRQRQDIWELDTLLLGGRQIVQSFQKQRLDGTTLVSCF